MNNLWKDDESRLFEDNVAKRVYTSRLLGRDRSLVLHGGGNTSVKFFEKNICCEVEEILYVKESVWDLGKFEKAGSLR
jgi:rhamnose utilization protein RhaD (predicted bifunctional aldolase and dehydrogenase)